MTRQWWVACACSQNLTRSIIRYLKGHGTHYVFDEGTWRHYRRVGLTVIELFQILKPFHDDDAKFNASIQHLIELGFLSRAELRSYGGANLLWGELLHKMNSKLAQYGGRLSIAGESGTVDGTCGGRSFCVARRASCFFLIRPPGVVPQGRMLARGVP